MSERAALLSPSANFLQGRALRVPLGDLSQRSLLGTALERLRGKSVLLAVQEQLTAALALIELDGVARRLILCPPDLPEQHLPAVVRATEAQACLFDACEPASVHDLGLEISLPLPPALNSVAPARTASHATEWVLLSSGTTGVPKLIVHTLESLCAAFVGSAAPPQAITWSTFYDIRRYGGLQILLRALHGGSLVLSSAGEPISDHLERAAAAAVSHISGTPSHWRAVLMSGAASRITPCYVRLSGEIADQAILDTLRRTYPQAAVAHAFASTEAGVAFEVKDGLAGFPASLLASGGAGGAELRLVDATLRVRSAGNARGYLAGSSSPADADGFVDTGDRLELRAGRYHFVGRSGGVINVGGQKVHPEEIEAVINAHPWVRMSRVKARRSPITGALVMAEVVLADEAEAQGARPAREVLTQQILERCRGTLASYKVPALIHIVPALEVSPAGKLVRSNA